MSSNKEHQTGPLRTFSWGGAAGVPGPCGWRWVAWPAPKLWLAQYFAKWAGQAPNMPARLTTLQSLVALVSAFAFIGGVQLIFNAINSTNWTADGLADPFSLPRAAPQAVFPCKVHIGQCGMRS